MKNKKKLFTIIFSTSLFSFILLGLLIALMIIILVSGASSGADPNCATGLGVNDNKNISSTPSAKEFVSSLKEDGIKAWVDYGVLPSTFIAQVALETGYGSSHLYKVANNTGGHKFYSGIDYGVGAYKSSEPAPLNEGGSEDNGRYYVYFPSISSSLAYQSKMFLKPPYTSYPILHNKDAKSVAKALQDSPYSQSSTYGAQLYAIIEANDLIQIDNEAFLRSANGGGKDTESETNSEKNNNYEIDLCEGAKKSGGYTGTNTSPTLDMPLKYKGSVSLPKPDNYNYIGNQYPFGECTWGAFNRMAQLGTPIEWFSGLIDGSGGYWWKSAQKKGYTVEKGKPHVAWAVSFPPGVAGSDSTYGHVAVVEYVNDDNSMLVSEVNVINPGTGTRSYRVIDSSTVSQAYFIKGK